MIKRNLAFGILTGMALFTFSCAKYGFDFKDGYQSGDSTETPLLTDTTMGKADKSLYHRARIYPGLVGESARRITDTTVAMLMDRAYTSPSEYKVSSTPAPIYSTGLYAPAGEVIRIIVPSGVIGLTIQVGAHTDNIMGKDAPRRDDIIYTRKELFPGTNYVKNLYGGAIWIINKEKKDSPIDLKFSGVVRSTNFILGTTSVNSWKQDVLSQDVPWMDLIGKRVAFTVPRSLVAKFIQQGRMDRVDEALRMWDESYERDYYNWLGLSEQNSDKKNRYPDFWERGVMDIHPSAGYAHSGNPWVMQEDDYWLDELTNPETVRNGPSWGAYHEVGHNYQATSSWSWADMTETTNNLFIFNAARNKGIVSRVHLQSSLHTSVPAALEFAKMGGSKKLSELPKEMVPEDQAPFAKLTPFLQIFDKVEGKNGESGWDFFPYIYSKSRNENFTTSLDQGKRDYFFRQLCHFAGKDFDRFFMAWGIPVSASAKREVRNLYPPITTALWEYNPLTYTGGDTPIPSKYDLDRTSWKITASSEHPGEGGGNGIIAALTDGNPQSFWMSALDKYAPHTLKVDMEETSYFAGVFYQARQNGCHIAKSVRIEYSRDNQNWITVTPDMLKNASSYTFDTQLKTFQLPYDSNAIKRKEFQFSSIVEARYIRYTFPDPTSYCSANFIGVAEIGAFYDTL